MGTIIATVDLLEINQILHKPFKTTESDQLFLINNDDKKVRWGLASGNCPELKGVGGWFKKNPHGVGVWGMELAHLIVEVKQRPCGVASAVG